MARNGGSWLVVVDFRVIDFLLFLCFLQLKLKLRDIYGIKLCLSHIKYPQLTFYANTKLSYANFKPF